jgi:transglutaminase-like putative cysteine protease
MTLEVEHTIHLEYSDYIRESWMELRVEPKALPTQSVRSFFLAVGPPSKVHTHLDWMGNVVHQFGVPGFHERIEVLARSVVDTAHSHPPISEVKGPVPDPATLGRDTDFLLLGGPVHDSPLLRALEVRLPGSAGLAERVGAAAAVVEERIAYVPGVTHYGSTIDDALRHGAGVCQDISHIMIGLLRLAGVPARYVSGYLYSPRRAGAPAESHAWVEYRDAAGAWHAYDPTNRQAPDGRYVVVAQGRSYDDVPPSKGVYRGAADESLTASVTVAEAPPGGVSDLRAKIGAIDVPVYAKVPGRAAEPANEPGEPGANAQQ